MKKMSLVIGFIITSSIMIFAQDIGEKVRNAVNELTVRVSTPVSVMIEPVYLHGTQSTSELSALLSNWIKTHASNNNRLRVRELQRNIHRVIDCTIKGTFLPENDVVKVTLQLVLDRNNQILGTSAFSITIEELNNLKIKYLPENYYDIEEKIPLPDPDPFFILKAWPNSDNNTYYLGDNLIINIESDRDCYFKIFHISADGKVKVVFPTERFNNNFLKAGVIRAIPGTGERALSFRIVEPAGQEKIIVAASVQQSGLPETIDNYLFARSIVENIIRGLNLRAKEDSNGLVIASFNFTSMSKGN